MRHPAQLVVLNCLRLRKTSFAVVCAIAVFLTTPATYGQRGAGGHLGGHAGGRSSIGARSRPSRGAPRAGFPDEYRRVPSSHFEMPITIGGPRLRLQFYRRSYLGYGFWPLYGWASSWAPDCAPYSGWDCYGNDYDAADTGEPPGLPPSEIGLNSVLVIYLRDGSGYGASDYWVGDGKLNFVTVYNSEKAVAFESVDWQRTVDDNAARGIYFTLRYSPSKQRYKPSIAPVCQASSSAKAHIDSSPSVFGSEAQSFGVTVSPTDQGPKVTFVRPGSPAAQVGINPGDVLLRIDCQTVHSGSDIESAIAANTTGTPWVSYLIGGAWLSEQQITVR